MKKVFISLPMNGFSNEDIKQRIERYRKEAVQIVGEELELIDSWLPEAPDLNNKALWYLSKSIELLAEADYAYFGEGWTQARGCRIEHLCAESYGIPIIQGGNDYGN